MFWQLFSFMSSLKIIFILFRTKKSYKFDSFDEIFTLYLPQNTYSYRFLIHIYYYVQNLSKIYNLYIRKIISTHLLNLFFLLNKP